jgi:hypothetical protein
MLNFALSLNNTNTPQVNGYKTPPSSPTKGPKGTPPTSPNKVLTPSNSPSRASKSNAVKSLSSSILFQSDEPVDRKMELLWNKCATPIAATNKENLLSQVKDSIDLYGALAYPVSPPPTTDAALLDQLQNDFKSKTLHENLDKYAFEAKQQPRIAPSPLLIGNQSIFPLLQNHPESHALYMNEEEKVSEKVLNQATPLAMNRNEMLRILVDEKKISRSKKGRDFNCFVLDIHELSFLLKIATKASMDIAIPKRFQIAVVQSVHYTGLDILISKIGNQALILDAALDDKYLDVSAALAKFSFSKVWASGIDDPKAFGIQKDADSCAYCTFDHLVKSSKRENLFGELEKLPSDYSQEDRVHYIDWKYFPGTFLKHVQSISIFEKDEVWAQKTLKGDELLSTYVKAHQMKIGKHMKNNSINEKIEKCKKKVEEYLIKNSDKHCIKVTMTSQSKLFSQWINAK